MRKFCIIAFPLVSNNKTFHKIVRTKQRKILFQSLHVSCPPFKYIDDMGFVDAGRLGILKQTRINLSYHVLSKSS